VTQNYSGLPSLPLSLSAQEIVGLKDPAEGDWARLRAVQYRDLHSRALQRVGGHCLAATIVVSLLYDDNPWWRILAWLAMLALAVFNTLQVERQLSNIDSRVMTKREFYAHGRAIAAMSTVWSLPMLGFPRVGD
jgi:hypothetical protein